MNNLYTAVTKKDGNWWIDWVIEIPGVNCQEQTHEKLLKSLKITLKEALKFNRRDALMIVGNDYKEEQIAL
jgi:predicted RNase H-like HicB family nuclease